MLRSTALAPLSRSSLFPLPAVAGSITGHAVVTDGDTVLVGGTPVRLKGVDAAELGTEAVIRARSVMVAILGFNGTLTCELTGEKTIVGKLDSAAHLTGSTSIKRSGPRRRAFLPRYSTRYVTDEMPSARLRLTRLIA